MDVDAPLGRILKGGSMMQRKIAAWVILSVVAGCWSDAPPSATPSVEGAAPSTRAQEVHEAEPVAFWLDLECGDFPWRIYSTVPLLYPPPCKFGQMGREAASGHTPAEELEQARSENTALHEGLGEMAAYEAQGHEGDWRARRDDARRSAERPMTVRSAGWWLVLVVLSACTKAGGKPPDTLCERYAEAAERVIGGPYREPEVEPPPVSDDDARFHLPAVGGPNAGWFYAGAGASLADYAPEVESRCSWRELNLVVEFAEVGAYFDPEIMLGSVLDDLRRKEGLDAYADRMRIVVEGHDSGFYAAFDPRD